MNEYQKIKYISCESMYEFSEGLATVNMKGKYGFIDKRGEIVIPCQYEYASVMKEGLAAVQMNKRFGYIDKVGNLIIPIIYDEAFDFSEGMAAVAYNDGLYGFIDKKGNLVIDYQYDDIAYGGFSEGLISVEKDGKYGFIDKLGNVISPFEYDFEAVFREGLAIVEKDEKYGAINPKGEIIIPIEYDTIAENGFYEGKILASKNSGKLWDLIDKTGETIRDVAIDTKHLYFSEGIARIDSFDYKCGCIDSFVNAIIPNEYEDMHNASEGLIPVKKDGKWGYINYKNEVIIPFMYQRASPFYDGLADVAMDRKVGFMIDKTNSIAFGVKKETNISKFVIRLVIILGIAGFILYKFLL